MSTPHKRARPWQPSRPPDAAPKDDGTTHRRSALAAMLGGPAPAPARLAALVTAVLLLILLIFAAPRLRRSSAAVASRALRSSESIKGGSGGGSAALTDIQGLHLQLFDPLNATLVDDPNLAAWEATVAAEAARQLPPPLVHPREARSWAPPQLLSILTPVYPDELTLGLLQNQLRTFDRHFDAASIAEWVLVTPRRKAAELQRFLDAELAGLGRIPVGKVRLLEDEECAPELDAAFLKEMAPVQHKYVDGWMKQQLLKLACAAHLSTPYYLVTDADLLYLNATTALDLLEPTAAADSAFPIADEPSGTAYRARNELQQNNDVGLEDRLQVFWMENSARTLNLSVPNATQSIGVTPQVLAAPIVAALGRYIEAQLLPAVPPVSINPAANATLLASIPASWHLWLLQRVLDYMHGKTLLHWSVGHEVETPWNPFTEYDLYWVFAASFGLWDQYHVHSYLQVWQLNVWAEEQFPGWEPCQYLEQGYTGHWAVVQSRLNISGDRIWEKLAKCA